MGEFVEDDTITQLRARFPVHFSCFEGNLNSLSQLLNSGKFDLYEEDAFRGWTPAHWAAHCGKLGCLMQLQCVGVNLNVATQRQHQTPLHVAAEAGHSACLTLLLERGVSLDIQDIHGETATHKAARHGHVECLQLLRTHEGCFKFPFSVCNNQGQTPRELFQQGVPSSSTFANSRKRSSFEEGEANNKRPKFAPPESLTEDATPPPANTTTTPMDYPMDFNEETIPPEYTAAAPSLFTSGEKGTSTEHPSQTIPDSSSNSIDFHTCPKGGSIQEDMHESLPENNNSVAQDQGMLSPTSVVEHRAAVSAQYGYERLCGSAYEMQCYGHFF